MSIDTDDPRLKWFRLAENVSKHSTYRVKVGCVLVKGNRPISVGFNKAKYNKIWGNPWRKSIHAEASAIMTSGRTYCKSIAYVYREKKDGTTGLARPCADCMSRLRIFGVKKVYYSIENYPFWRMENV